MNKLIEFKDVCYKFSSGESDKYIIKNITFQIEKGEFIALIGSNGSGKSTLAKHLNGLLLPTSGEVVINGMNTKDENMQSEIRKKVGIVFQNPDNQIIACTVEEEIAFGLENLSVAREKMDFIIESVLKKVNLSEFRNKSVTSLSGGQKQRLNIASVIAMEPEILVLDEPTSMLDPMGRKSVLDLIKMINSINKTTVILITHSMEEALLADKAILMSSGIIKFFDSPYKLFSNKNVSEAFNISPTQSLEILLFLKNLGYDVSLEALDTKKCASEIIKLLESNN